MLMPVTVQAASCGGAAAMKVVIVTLGRSHSES